ncbi:UDP-2,3-diacylglucosamine diphosphatase [Halopseudomonas salegens]|uniref:UDP-2,3-diacylglucosamine hydrolase n=1 Tax=Halopseudomonas salegens TaxID=1434072 RepID=A0A1H2F3N9_9GAMM|nr:UDP-2,3-diacylglucosamine diphosphatase [Halopseudomonas salegens]SDU01935.1 UDP-2,3-diacylglucosamine hydrolase [Halopseudomonas salegens]
MRSLFISDLHLEQKRPDITRAFLHLLAGPAEAADHLYILGDFFEVWLGDDATDELAESVISALAARAARGKQTFIMHGNRDFLLGKHFCRRARCTLLPDPCVIDLHNEKVLLMHGDSLCIDDIDYMRMRRLLRNPLSRFILRSLPRGTRKKIGHKLRSESSARTRMKSSEITDVNPGKVAEVMRQHGVKRLIHGHTHRPDRHPLVIDGEPAERIVLGDWDTHAWTLWAEETGLTQQADPLD